MSVHGESWVARKKHEEGKDDNCQFRFDKYINICLKKALFANKLCYTTYV